MGVYTLTHVLNKNLANFDALVVINPEFILNNWVVFGCSAL